VSRRAPIRNTVRLGLQDPRIHALILGYWHTIITPPMVFAKLMVEVVEEMRAKGIEKPVGGLACRRRGGEEEAAGSTYISTHSRLRLFHGDSGRRSRRQVQVGAWRGSHFRNISANTLE